MFCESYGEAPTTVLSNIGISKSAYTGWKRGAEPSNRTKKQVADYFKVTVSEFMNGQTQKEKPVTDNDDRLNDMKKLLIEQVKQLDDSQVVALSRIADEILRLREK